MPLKLRKFIFMTFIYLSCLLSSASFLFTLLYFIYRYASWFCEPDCFWHVSAYISKVVGLATIIIAFPIYCALSSLVWWLAVSAFSYTLSCCFLCCFLCALVIFKSPFCFLIMSKSLVSVKLSTIIFCESYDFIPSIHDKTCLLVILLVSLILFSCFIISAVMVWSFIPFMNYSLAFYLVLCIYSL